MKHAWYKFHSHVTPWHHMWSEAVLILAVALIFISPASAAMRFQERSLFMNSTEPGATTFYTIAFRYMSEMPVGSVDMLFCEDPIPYHPCVTPPGLDVSNATLSNQTGEIGYSISTRSASHIVLSRPAAELPTAHSASYTLDNIVNPSDTTQAFAVRLKSLASTDGTGSQIDFGSVRGEVVNGIVIETQVPPMLIFCAARQVEENCTDTDQNYYTDMGTLEPDATLTAQSQMAVGTNATAGFAITANGTSLSAGMNEIDSLVSPTASIPGTNQFGINLVANNSPSVGQDPEGLWANAIAAPGYDVPNQYKFVSGDLVATSPNVSLMKKFTVSYILNSSPELRPGVYTTTVTYIASGRF